MEAGFYINWGHHRVGDGGRRRKEGGGEGGWGGGGWAGSPTQFYTCGDFQCELTLKCSKDSRKYSSLKERETNPTGVILSPPKTHSEQRAQASRRLGTSLRTCQHTCRSQVWNDKMTGQWNNSRVPQTRRLWLAGDSSFMTWLQTFSHKVITLHTHVGNSSHWLYNITVSLQKPIL